MTIELFKRQYSSSTIINKLISDRGGYFANDWQDQFYELVWNVDTAQGIGLDIWGRIVVIGRSMQIDSTDYFGFNTSFPQSWQPFGQAPFFSGEPATLTYTLTDQAYRVLILTKALSNISATDVFSLNRVLLQLFPGRGRAWVNDLGGMSMRYVFEFPLEPWELSVMVNGGVMPRPAGVGVKIAIIPPDTFGFAGANWAPFGQGTFFNTGAILDVNSPA